jgi:2,3-bisphosphoglycerate-independent phosphoglycerate mutase
MLDELVLSNDNKIVFLVLDGLGDIPNADHSYLTPLEAAVKPNIDRLAMERGVLGRAVPVEVGVTPGSGPGHLGLFGYDPLRYEIGRGILEVLGLNMDLQDNDIAARGNFCTVRDGVVTDRRAGRIPTELTRELCSKMSAAIPEVDGVKVVIKPGVSHRFAIIFRGEGLSDELEDADPHKDNRPVVPVVAKSQSAERTARVINLFVQKVMEVLKDEPKANGVLLRGFSKKPDMPSFAQKYKLNALAITTYPMYRGIAKVLGMKVENEPKDYDEMVAILREHYEKYQFFFMHVKETDVAGEDGNFEEKKRAIELVDRIVPAIYDLKPKVLVITGDHSTPCPMKGHSWHPVPLLMIVDTGERDSLPFYERSCLSGSLGTIFAKEIMPIALAYGSKLDKFGA